MEEIILWEWVQFYSAIICIGAAVIGTLFRWIGTASDITLLAALGNIVLIIAVVSGLVLLFSIGIKHSLTNIYAYENHNIVVINK